MLAGNNDAKPLLSRGWNALGAIIVAPINHDRITERLFRIVLSHQSVKPHRMKSGGINPSHVACPRSILASNSEDDEREGDALVKQIKVYPLGHGRQPARTAVRGHDRHI